MQPTRKLAADLQRYKYLQRIGKNEVSKKVVI
jgi:hypothetical protein